MIKKTSLPWNPHKWSRAGGKSTRRRIQRRGWEKTIWFQS